jgi:hypothetical protein
MRPYSKLVPGSDEAVAVGCTCPNAAQTFDGYYWVDSECPLHGTNTDVGEEDIG